MQQAIPYEVWRPVPIHAAAPSSGEEVQTAADIGKLLSENALSVLGRKGCCMATVVRRLLLGLGVNPAIYEVEGESGETEILAELRRINGDLRDVVVQLPAVFVGGKLFGGLDRVMATHISGELVPILKEAGALWL
ncbi:hypothetical protein MLD38_009178 [Melastoma candidum]|uniref:Uncharacterized protein n=1 Tax=Melastoma candidum TaxID=119954 RepID=A0ACB9S122_9MYRT|nr:hypothetical protein MLD38_009178 [Melastoma candidum]